jgi:hypothetical protein
MGGGGGSTGKVDYPSYMKDWHHDFLDIYRADYHEYVTKSPFEDNVGHALVAYDPGPYIRAIADYHVAGEPVVANVIRELFIDWGTGDHGLTYLLNSLFDNTAIPQSVAAYATLLYRESDKLLYPAFDMRMRADNAVVGSAFVLGHAVLARKQLKTISEFAGGLYSHRQITVMKAGVALLLSLARLYATMTIEANRISIVAEKEQSAKDNEYRILQAKWHFDILTYGGNLLAHIGSATVHHTNKADAGKSALSGAMSGMGIGASIGSIVPGIGTLIGAVVGAALGGITGYALAESGALDTETSGPM